MNLVKFYGPRYNVNRNLVDDLFSNFLKNDYHENYLKNCSNQPATNVFETESEFRIEMMLPGFKKEEVQIHVQKNVLTVKVVKENGEEQKPEEYKYAHREFGSFSFDKQFKLPETVNVEKINAVFENGILNLKLPKKEEILEKSPVEITIA